MHQRFRRDPEHDQGGDRQRTEGDGAAIDHDRDQHHRGHEERALGRHFRARKQQIKRRSRKRCDRRPFLDRRYVKRRGSYSEKACNHCAFPGFWVAIWKRTFRDLSAG
jgi:hypothetical protein